MAIKVKYRLRRYTKAVAFQAAGFPRWKSRQPARLAVTLTAGNTGCLGSGDQERKEEDLLPMFSELKGSEIPQTASPAEVLPSKLAMSARAMMPTRRLS